MDINSKIKFNHPIIQENWKNYKIPHFPGITIGNGEIVPMNELSSYSSDGSTHIHVDPICKSTIESFIEFSGRATH
ncbi:hypothetical protein V8J88_23930 [Massilia sp. W12]|uniref:hypothetical protein n=1 Tax=Massilia sp. W12 TaxID=3126507 RepID=UPI0030CB5898